MIKVNQIRPINENEFEIVLSILKRVHMITKHFIQCLMNDNW